MTIHPFKLAVALLALVLPLASAAATAEEEAAFVGAVKKAFEERKAAGLSSVTCWDGVSEQARKKQEETYTLLVEQKDVTFSVKLVEAGVKEQKDGASARQPNLKVVKQLDVHLIDGRDQKLLGIIGFPMGEKDGKLLLAQVAAGK